MDSTNTSVEKKIRPEGPWEIIKKLRVQAAERGISPVDIDIKILQGEFGNLDPEVRAILESQISGAKSVENKEVVTEAPERTVEVSKQVEAKSPGVERVDIGGLNVVDKMRQIAKEVGAKETGKENAMIETREQEPQEIATQTSEQKELTTTQGTQNTSSGVAKRQSLGVYGYIPSQQVASRAQVIAEKGSVSESKTWQAMIMQRFMEIWGSFRGIFSVET